MCDEGRGMEALSLLLHSLEPLVGRCRHLWLDGRLWRRSKRREAGRFEERRGFGASGLLLLGALALAIMLVLLLDLELIADCYRWRWAGGERDCETYVIINAFPR